MFLCIPRTSKKYLVHGALIEADDIDLPSPMYLLNLAWILGAGALSIGVSTPPKWSEIFLFVSGTSKQNLVHGALKKLRYWPPLPPVFAQLGLVSWHQHSSHRCVNTSQVVWNIPVCLRNLQTKFGTWGSNGSWDIDLPSPMYLLHLAQVLGAGTPPISVSTPPKWSRNVPMFLRKLQKNLVPASTVGSEHNSISEVPTPDPLGVYVPAPNPLGV